MIASLTGLLLGFLIGVGCRWFDLPLPAPPRIVGALLVVFMAKLLFWSGGIEEFATFGLPMPALALAATIVLQGQLSTVQNQISDGIW
jgi:XapX domain-containing protein